MPPTLGALREGGGSAPLGAVGKYRGDTLGLVAATKERGRQTGRARFVLAAGAGALVAGTGIEWAPAQHPPAALAAVQEAAPLPPAQMPQNIQGAGNAPDRPAADKSLAAGRNPEPRRAFFGIGPGMKVADLFAASGDTTE